MHWMEWFCLVWGDRLLCMEGSLFVLSSMGAFLEGI